MNLSSQASPINNSNQQSADISYQFDFARFLEHLVDVALTFTADTDAPSLWLPSWIPGSYLMLAFARNITSAPYEILDSHVVSNAKHINTYRAQKTDNNTWQLTQAEAGQRLFVHNVVY
mgnify:CR=1 FL=1